MRENVDRVATVPGPYGIPIPVILNETRSQKADKALNNVSTRHGAALDRRDISAKDIANKIRKEVCE